MPPLISLWYKAWSYTALYLQKLFLPPHSYFMFIIILRQSLVDITVMGERTETETWEAFPSSHKVKKRQGMSQSILSFSITSSQEPTQRQDKQSRDRREAHCPGGGWGRCELSTLHLGNRGAKARECTHNGVNLQWFLGYFMAHALLPAWVKDQETTDTHVIVTETGWPLAGLK